MTLYRYVCEGKDCEGAMFSPKNFTFDQVKEKLRISLKTQGITEFKIRLEGEEYEDWRN